MLFFILLRFCVSVTFIGAFRYCYFYSFYCSHYYYYYYYLVVLLLSSSYFKIIIQEVEKKLTVKMETQQEKKELHTKAMLNRLYEHVSS